MSKNLLSSWVKKKEFLHPQFTITKFDDRWEHNRTYKPWDGVINSKVRVLFDDLSLLDNCPFMAKVGTNFNGHIIPLKYVAFCYGNGKNREELMAYARTFPYAEIIDGLNDDGTMHEHSLINRLAGDELVNKEAEEDEMHFRQTMNELMHLL